MRTNNHLLRAVVFLVLSLLSGSLFAAAAGTVVHVIGTLSVRHPDGSVAILGQKSEVNPGDVLTTQRDSYAEIDFTDGSSMTLRPNSQLKLDGYSFAKDKPKEDGLFVSLLKGGLRTVTGLIGHRGNQDAYQIKTSAATIGIRGSSGDTLECSQGCEGVTPTSGKVPHGVYHTTYTGLYIMQNAAGSQLIGKGQWGYAKDSKTPPALLPGDPGFGLKSPPFGGGGGGGGLGGDGGGGGAVAQLLGISDTGEDEYGAICLVR